MIIDGKSPQIIDDKLIDLIYVSDLTNELTDIITSSNKFNIDNYVKKNKSKVTL